MIRLIQIHPADNVAVALRALPKGHVESSVTLRQDTPASHKVALRPIAPGERVTKYGYPIGLASRPIGPGDHVHTDNLASHVPANLDPTAFVPGTPVDRKSRGLTFEGYRRADGRFGIRNQIWGIPTVGCVNQVA